VNNRRQIVTGRSTRYECVDEPPRPYWTAGPHGDRTPATVTSLMIDALGRRGSPQAWSGPAQKALTPADLALIGPLLGHPKAAFVSDCLVPKPETFAPTFREDLDRMGDTPPRSS
jgi:hypothetical protein